MTKETFDDNRDLCQLLVSMGVPIFGFKPDGPGDKPTKRRGLSSGKPSPHQPEEETEGDSDVPPKGTKKTRDERKSKSSKKPKTSSFGRTDGDRRRTQDSDSESDLEFTEDDLFGSRPSSGQSGRTGGGSRTGSRQSYENWDDFESKFNLSLIHI